MKKSTFWIDGLSFIFSIAAIGLAILWVIYSDTLATIADYTVPSTWQLIRSTGLTAYILATLSTLWGIALSSKIVKDWSPGTISLLLHASTSWLAVVFGAIHAILLLFDEYLTYEFLDLLVPFRGPYRPFAVGLGIIGFWILLVVNASFSVRKLMGNKYWRWLHYTSYLSFGLVSVHTLSAGTDATRIGYLFMLGVAMISVIALWLHRISPLGRNPKKKNRSANQPVRAS